MSANTKIEWADHTFNAWFGCTKVSPGCDHCYAEQSLPAKFSRIEWGPGQPRRRTSEGNWKDPLRWNRQHAEFYAQHGRRQRVFCNSLGDIMDKEVPVFWRVDLFRLIFQTPNLDYLILTKRIGNAAGMIREVLQLLRDEGLDVPAWPWANVWLGATVVNQEEADRDVVKLLSTPAAVRFLSLEPLLGPVDLSVIDLDGHGEIYPLTGTSGCEDLDGNPLPDLPRVDWVIVGGESGPNARALHPQWARALLAQCQATGVAFFFKQWGHWQPIEQGPHDWFVPLYEDVRVPEGRRRCRVRRAVICNTGEMTEDLAAAPWDEASQSMLAYAVGKKAAGRLLDGREWSQIPA